MQNVVILFTSKFLSDSKRLSKKYYSFKNDLQELIKELKLNPKLGSQLSKNIFKISLKITAKGKGKSSGARVITYLIEGNSIYLVTVYDKSEKINITDKEIKEIISKLNL